VLVADDEDGLRRMSREILGAAGYHVLEAENGAQAIDVYRRHMPDVAVVLLDLLMPETDGREAVAAIRALDPAARIVLMSGFDHHEVLDGVRSEVAGFLAKPYGAAELLEAVREACGPPARSTEA
jgi:two-component system chemotaxis response regulator CheY